MSKKYFLPGDDPGKVLWLDNFATKLKKYAAKYGITAAELADMENSFVWFAYWIDILEKVRTYSQGVTAFKNEVRDGLDAAGGSPSLTPEVPVFYTLPTAVAPGVFDRATALAARIKGYQSYTVADGEDMGIEGPEDSSKPTPPVV